MPLEWEKVKLEGDASRMPALQAEDVLAAWLLPGVVRRMPAGGLQGALFDLDGVLVETAEFHYLAWKQVAEELGLKFDRQANEGFRGVGRMECLEKLLGVHSKQFVLEEKRVLAQRKNEYYRVMVETLTHADAAKGAMKLLVGLRAAGVRTAVVSASRNARDVLKRVGLTEWFDAIVDGGDVKETKPEPEGFLLAAQRVGAAAAQCVVIEDAEAGVEAGRRGGMKTVGIGAARGPLRQADMVVEGVGQLTVGRLCELFPLDRAGLAGVVRGGGLGLGLRAG